MLETGNRIKILKFSEQIVCKILKNQECFLLASGAGACIFWIRGGGDNGVGVEKRQKGGEMGREGCAEVEGGVGG